MEIVIKISEDIYKEWKLGGKYCRHSYAQRLILNGTPLPEHHGRLKDVDAFITKVKADRKHSAYLRSWTADDVLNALDYNYAPTIIEADSAESEDKE